MYLYRTQVGIRFINYVGEKYKRLLSVFGFIGVVCGYLLMVAMIYFLYQLVYIYLFVPEVVKAIKIPPLMPLIPYLPEAFNISFLPPFYFTYWILAIAVIAIFHEFAHGIIARRYGVEIKTTGFGFLGPFLAAFVEPNEEEMEKKTKYQQIAILSAGVFTNLILAILFFLVLSLFFVLTYVPAGAMFNTYTAGVVGVSSISMINGIVVESGDAEGLLGIINQNNLSNDLILGSNGNSIELMRIVAGDGVYYTSVDSLRGQLDKGVEEIVLYVDFPAINAGLRGVIVEIDGVDINDHDDLAGVMDGKGPGDVVKITTEEDDEVLEYELELEEDPMVEGRGVIGIGFYGTNNRILGKITDFFNFFKKPATFYAPRFNVDLVVFIYNLIWWLALINLSVALINMWPVAIFDGGRMFMLTVWGITGSEKFAMFMFKLVTYLIIGALFLLMWGWFGAMFL